MTVKLEHQISSVRESSLPLSFNDLGQMNYQAAWDMQLSTVQARLKNEQNDTVLFVEHESVYTAGKRTQPSDRPVLTDIPVIEVDRGGKITWHGPGQLVAYPIIKLLQPLDVVRYVRRIELAIMATCREFGVETHQIPGRSGVWLCQDSSDLSDCARYPDKKIAAIGIRISQGITQHGLALNCNNSLQAYSHIIPCGLNDAGVTSLSAEIGHNITSTIVKPVLAKNLELSLTGNPCLWEKFPGYTDK